MSRFLHRCRRRLDVRGVEAQGEIYQAVVKAHQALHDLTVVLYSAAWDRPPSHRPRERRGSPKE
jgi:hypothetical protein